MVTLSEHAIRERIAFHEVELLHWREIMAKKSCRSCVNFEDGYCKLAGDTTPPPEVIRTGCGQWMYDFIPF